MSRSTTSTALHTDAEIVAVAEGLTLVMGTDGAAEQLRRIYGEQRVARALMPLTSPTPVSAPVEDRGGAILNKAHPRFHPVGSRSYGPRPRTGRVYWL